MAQLRNKGRGKASRLITSLWVVLISGDDIHPKSAADCHNEFGQELGATVGERLRRDTLVGHPVLKNVASYFDSVGFCARYCYS